MQRREFIGGVLCAALFTRLGFAEGLEKTLLSLAHVIIPDREPAVWISSDVAAALVEEIENLGNSEREQVAFTLESLNSAAIRQEGNDFHELSLQLRTSLVNEQLTVSESMKQGFTTFRAKVLKCFYSSDTGHHRTGYRETSQFEGYPEYLQMAETWD